MPANNVVVLITGKDDTQGAFQAVQQNLTKMGEKAQETQEHIHGLGLSFSKFFEAEFAVHAVLDALSRLKELAEQVGEIAERLNIMHEATGISMQSLTAFAAEGHMAGVSLEQLQRSVSHMEQSFEEARQGLTEDKRAYAELGISVDALSKKHATMDQVLMKVADGFQKVTDPAKRAYAAIEIFGRAGALLLPFLEEGSDGIKKMTENLKEMGVDVSEQGVANLAQLDRQMRMMEIDTMALASTFTSALRPALESIGNAFSDANGSAGSLAATLGGEIGNILKTIASAFVEVNGTVKITMDLLMGLGHANMDFFQAVGAFDTGHLHRARMEITGMAADLKTYTDAAKEANEEANRSESALWGNHPAKNAPIQGGGFIGDETAGIKGRGGRAKPLNWEPSMGFLPYDLESQADAFAAAQKKMSDEYDEKVYRMQQIYRSYGQFTKNEDLSIFENKMQLMDKFYGKHGVDPALDPIARVTSADTLRTIREITDATTSAAAATDNFAKAWERAATQIAKIFADMAVARWGPGGTHPLGHHDAQTEAMSSIASAVGAGMPAPSGANSARTAGIIPSLSRSALHALGMGKGSGGSQPVTVNLYNQGSASTVTKTSAVSKPGAGSMGDPDAMLEKKVIDIFMKDATTNGPMWQTIGSVVGGALA